MSDAGGVPEGSDVPVDGPPSAPPPPPPPPAAGGASAGAPVGGYPEQQGYQQAGYQPQYAPQYVPQYAPQYAQQQYVPQNGTTMLVVAILSLVICPFLSIWSYKESKKAKQDGESMGMRPDGITTASYIISIVGLVYSAIWLLFVAFYAIIIVVALAAGTASAAGVGA